MIVREFTARAIACRNARDFAGAAAWREAAKVADAILSPAPGGVDFDPTR